MDYDKFKKNIGRTFQFIPHPRRDSAQGSFESDMNTWILKGETADKKGFEFLNAIRDHDPFVLDLFQMRNFDAPDKLVLRGQVILKDTSVIFEPFYPKPATNSVPSTRLRLFIEGEDENGLTVISTLLLEPLRFMVSNMGEQTVCDFKNTVLAPPTFARVIGSSYFGNLSMLGETEIGEQLYTKYGNHVATPIYKKTAMKIGDLTFKADPGDYILLWQIHCDDGVFPSETTYGELKIRVTPLIDLVKRASENLFDKP